MIGYVRKAQHEGKKKLHPRRHKSGVRKRKRSNIIDLDIFIEATAILPAGAFNITEYETAVEENKKVDSLLERLRINVPQ